MKAVKGKELGHVFCRSTIRVRYNGVSLVLPTYVIEEMLSHFNFDIERKIINEHLVHPEVNYELGRSANLASIPEHADHMTIDEWLHAVEQGYFIDYDGYGFYATEDGMSDVLIRPSDVQYKNLQEGWTHIVWLNR